MKNLLIIVLFTVSTCSLYSQSKTLRGRVISELFEVMPSVLIKFNDTSSVGRTDLDGYYEIEVPITVTRLEFNAIGAEPTVILLTDKCDEADVVMMWAIIYDFVSLKKANRLRMKRFKKLPKLRKEAFEKGLLKTAAACYTQVFEPY